MTNIGVVYLRCSREEISFNRSSTEAEALVVNKRLGQWQSTHYDWSHGSGHILGLSVCNFHGGEPFGNSSTYAEV